MRSGLLTRRGLGVDDIDGVILTTEEFLLSPGLRWHPVP
jgi:hypothetical protein